MSTPKARTFAVVEEFLASHDLSHELVDERTFLVSLPGSAKLETHCALVVGDHSLGVNAFVIRKPDENLAQVHEWLLRKNATMYSVAFAINEIGDIYLVGRLSHAAVSERELRFCFQSAPRARICDRDPTRVGLAPFARRVVGQSQGFRTLDL
jgi:hypothetical protein